MTECDKTDHWANLASTLGAEPAPEPERSIEAPTEPPPPMAIWEEAECECPEIAPVAEEMEPVERLAEESPFAEEHEVVEDLDLPAAEPPVAEVPALQPPAPEPARKPVSTANWDGLAAELGIVPIEPPPPPPARRPVAEKLAAEKPRRSRPMPPSAFAPEPKAEETAKVTEAVSDPADDLSDVADDLAIGAEEEEFAEVAHESVAEEEDSVGEGSVAEDSAAEEEEKRGRRRRRRRRRSAMHGLSRKPRRQRRRMICARMRAPEVMESLDFDDEVEGDDESSPAETPETPREPRERRRRRRRGSRRERPAAESDVSEPLEADEFESTDLEVERDLEAEEPFGGEAAVREPAEDYDGDLPAGEDDEDGDDQPRLGFRNIPTWEDAVGTIIAKNMEARAKNPGGGRQGQGRGRGGRGNRRR